MYTMVCEFSANGLEQKVICEIFCELFGNETVVIRDSSVARRMEQNPFLGK